jgi:hypothetical protein
MPMSAQSKTVIGAMSPPKTSAATQQDTILTQTDIVVQFPLAILGGVDWTIHSVDGTC